MIDFAAEYHLLSDDELLQIWVERTHLTSEAKHALQDEIRRRNLTKETEHAVDAYANPPQPSYAPPPRIFSGGPVWFALRELWLRWKTTDGPVVEGHVVDARRSKPRVKSTSRAELLYSYEYQGKQYTGRVVRDFMWNNQAGNALGFGHHPGEVILVRIDPEHPNRSYFASGFGWIEPIYFAVIGLFLCGVWIAVLLERLW